jgi:hypothetical protein
MSGMRSATSLPPTAARSTPDPTRRAMSQPSDQDFTQLDRFLGDMMAGILAKCEKAFDPSGRLASLSHNQTQPNGEGQ